MIFRIGFSFSRIRAVRAGFRSKDGQAGGRPTGVGKKTLPADKGTYRRRPPPSACDENQTSPMMAVAVRAGARGAGRQHQRLRAGVGGGGGFGAGPAPRAPAP
ncbi:hypothetical protein NKI45_31840, partial [Mesorhizobium sp. M0619]|uniref:hypothetical protein n=1 Tax=Mesorhizobium sp. M0619 TaxID=2956973 RepID=UPI00333CC377